jgi:RNA polymerase sigma-70 factor, ECF subfamily
MRGSPLQPAASSPKLFSMASETDRLLIDQIRAGDTSAWDQLIARYEGRLLAFVDRRIHDRTASEDVVQETFVGFLNSLPNFDERRELQTYLFTIASHKLTDHLRRMGRHPLHHVSDSPGDVLHQQVDSHKAASSLVRSQERKELESEAVGRGLGQMLRQWQERGDHVRVKVMELLFVKGWANRDVAAFLGVSEQQVANYRFAAVKKLTEHIRAAGLPADVFPELQ